MPVPGPTLVLERGTRVQVTIVNHSQEHAAVHWHGIELESYPDGVPGWSGTDGNVLPLIAPHESLTVAWTPPRAGSYMYHSHVAEAHQMGAGLYGPIIVLDSGQRYDPETDRVFFFGTAGMITNFQGYPDVIMNGTLNPPPIQLVAGRRYRFRFFNLAGDSPTRVTLESGGKAVTWHAVAKDGYPLPPSQATMRPAKLTFDPGEIYDFEFEPSKAGELSLAFGLRVDLPPAKPGAPPPVWPPNLPPRVSVPVHVR
jgi:manganese oxidase